jgi:putative tryptophan/tyrosine transport system substrate-binding protein
MQEAPMTRHAIKLLVTLTLAILVAPLAAKAQQRANVPHIGVLTLATASTAVAVKYMEAFRQGLRDLGYVAGQNLVIEYRGGEGKVERLPALAAEFVQLKVDCMVVGGTQASQAAKHATTTIPIVMISSDPVGTGLVTSLARPGGNITGLTLMNPELSGKRLELLQEVVPGLSRVAILWHGGHPGALLALQETEAAGRVLGVQLQSLEVHGPNDFEPAFAAATKEGTEALIMLPSAFFNAERRRIVAFVTKSRLAAIFPDREYAQAGGFMAYGPSMLDAWRCAAYYVHRILQGAKPADLPVEQPMTFELVINLKAAQALGLTIPASFLFQATEVIR